MKLFYLKFFLGFIAIALVPGMASATCYGQSVSCFGNGCGGRNGYINYDDSNECVSTFDDQNGCYYERGTCNAADACSASDRVSCAGMGCGGRSGYVTYDYSNGCESTWDSNAGCYYDRGVCR